MTGESPYTSLLSDLRSATGPDRMLDARIERLITGKLPNSDFRRYVERHGVPNTIPHYTDSVDAARKLVPEGCGWEVGGDERPAFWARVYARWPRRATFAQIHAIQQAPTPAIALCIAAISRRESTNDR